MLTADLNYRYFTALAARYQGYDRWAKIFVAVMSSAAVSGWAIWGQPGVNWLWQAASALATIVAVALPIINPANSVNLASRLAGGWFSILKDYEVLWVRLDSESEESAQEACGKVLQEEKRLVDLETNLRKNERLARAAELNVRRSRGLPIE